MQENVFHVLQNTLKYFIQWKVWMREKIFAVLFPIDLWVWSQLQSFTIMYFFCIKRADLMVFSDSMCIILFFYFFILLFLFYDLQIITQYMPPLILFLKVQFLLNLVDNLFKAADFITVSYIWNAHVFIYVGEIPISYSSAQRHLKMIKNRKNRTIYRLEYYRVRLKV